MAAKVQIKIVNKKNISIHLQFLKNYLYLCSRKWASPVRPAPSESPRMGT